MKGNKSLSGINGVTELMPSMYKYINFKNRKLLNNTVANVKPIHQAYCGGEIRMLYCCHKVFHRPCVAAFMGCDQLCRKKRERYVGTKKLEKYVNYQ